jgi:hypothetical protein
LFVIDTTVTDPAIQNLIKLLTQAVAVGTPVTTTYNPFYLVLFDGKGAW